MDGGLLVVVMKGVAIFDAGHEDHRVGIMNYFGDEFDDVGMGTDETHDFEFIFEIDAVFQGDELGVPDADGDGTGLDGGMVGGTGVFGGEFGDEGIVWYE